MNARFDEGTPRRWLGIAGAVIVIAIPIALVAATWEPLEPLPRAARPALVEDGSTPERSREGRRERRQGAAEEERAPRRIRDPAPAMATPGPGNGD